MGTLAITARLTVSVGAVRNTIRLTQHARFGQMDVKLGDTMLETLKIIHFLGLIMGIGGGMANALAASGLAAVPAGAHQIVGQFRASLGKMSTIGLIILWLSGIWMLLIAGADTLLDDRNFQLKLAAVIILTGFSIAANITVMQAKKAGGPPDAARMKLIGSGAMLFGLLALLMAVITFS